MHSVCVHIENVHLLLWADLTNFSYIFRILNLVIFYHCLTLTVPSWCNLNCKCSINIIHPLYSVFRHTEDMHPLLWTVLINVFLDCLHVELVIFITLSHRRYLICVIWNSKSVQLILFKRCTVFIYILKMFTCFYTPTNKDWGYKGITSICLSVHTDFVSRHTGISVYKNAYITGMFCSDAGPDTILVKGFVTRLTRPVPLVELELLTLPEHLSSPPVFSGVRVTRSLVLCVCFVCRSLFVLLYFFIWPLCCLFFFDIRILITPLISSNSSMKIRFEQWLLTISLISSKRATTSHFNQLNTKKTITRFWLYRVGTQSGGVVKPVTMIPHALVNLLW